MFECTLYIYNMHYYQMQPYPLYPCVKTTKKNKLCALNFSLSFMTFIKNNGFYMKILWYILKFPESSPENSSQPKSSPLRLRQKVTFSSPRRSPGDGDLHNPGKYDILINIIFVI